MVPAARPFLVVPELSVVRLRRRDFVELGSCRQVHPALGDAYVLEQIEVGRSYQQQFEIRERFLTDSDVIGEDGDRQVSSVGVVQGMGVEVISSATRWMAAAKALLSCLRSSSLKKSCSVQFAHRVEI